MSARTFILALILLFSIMTSIWFINDISKMSEDQKEENTKVMSMILWLSIPLIYILLNLTIRSIIRDRNEERYYIYRQRQLYKGSIKEK